MRNQRWMSAPIPAIRLVAGMAAAAAVWLAPSCGAPAPEEGPDRAADPVVVEVQEVRSEMAPDLRRYPASLEPEARITISSRLLASVETVTRREGEAVREGEILVRLDERELRAVLEQARAAVARAEAEKTRAEAQFHRMERLLAKGSATRKNLEDAEAAYRVARAAHVEAKAAVASAEARLAYASIRAPRNAWVVERHVEPGDTASPGQPLLVLEDVRRLRVRFEVPVSEASALKPGAPVSVELRKGSRVEAKIRTVVPSADQASRTVRAEAWLDNDGGSLRPGRLVHVLVAVSSRPKLRIPRSALVRRGGLEGVFVMDAEGRARLRWIRLGETSSESAEVLSGLGTGERIIVLPPPGLHDGTPVQARVTG